MNIKPSNFHQIAGSSTPGHPPVTVRTTPVASGIPTANPRKRIPNTIAVNPAAGLAAIGNALTRTFGRK